MTSKSKFISKFLVNAILIIFSLFKIIPSLVVLIEAEARAAKKSLVSLVVLYLFISILLITTWLCLLSMGFVYLISLHYSVLLSLFFVFLFNILLLILAIFMILSAMKHLSFPSLRDVLRELS